MEAKTESTEIYAYSESELEALDEHCSRCFGDDYSVFHSVWSDEIHLDVLCVEPSAERDWITLVTQGAGTRPMNLPAGVDPKEFARAEYLICLPSDWVSQDALADLANGSREQTWPMWLVKFLASFVITDDTWLGWGHTVDCYEPFADNTELCEALLLEPYSFSQDSWTCTLPNGDIVNFYQVVPLYREEADYAVANGTQALLERLSPVLEYYINPHRPNCCA